MAPAGDTERGAGTALAIGLGLVLLLAMTSVFLLAQAAVLASRAATAADLAALAAADAARGLSSGEPCAVAAETAGLHAARVVGCTVEPGGIVQVHTESRFRTAFGPATGFARAGPPPPVPAGPSRAPSPRGTAPSP